MKTILTLAIIFATLTSFAQFTPEYNYDWDYQINSKYNQPFSYQPPVGVKEVTYVITKKNGDVKQYNKTFNEKGYETTFSRILKTGELVPIIEFDYDSNGYLSVTKRYKKGKLKGSVERTRLKNGKVTKVVNKNKEGVMVSKNVWEYNSDSCLAKSFNYKKDDQLNRTWEYEYHSPCDKSKSVLKNKKGKVQHVWVYDCKMEGEELKAKKNTNQVCKWDETEKDILIRVNENFNAKGEVVKYVTKFNLSDTSIIESSKYNADGELTFKSVYNGDFKKPIKQEYYRKGKLWLMYDYTYEGGKRTSYVRTFKGKVTGKKVYKYESERMVEQTSFDKNNEVIKTVSLSYS